MTDLMRETETAEQHACEGCLDRRQLLTRAGGASLAVAGAALLAACGSSKTPGGSTPTGTTGGGGSDPEPLAQVADVPVGGALAATDADGNNILLVQASEGTITAFSAVCTHQGCQVAPDDGELHCPCHNSVFALDGSNVSGPAEEPLPAVEVHVQDGAVYPGAA